MLMTPNTSDSIILLMHKAFEQDANISELIDKCEQESNAITKAIDKKLEILKGMDRFTEEIVTMKAFMTENMHNFVEQISTVICQNDEDIQHHVTSVKERLSQNRQVFCQEVTAHVLDKIRLVIKDLDKAEEDMAMYKKMEKMLKKIERKRTESTNNFKKNIHLFRHRDDSMKIMESTKKAVIDYFSHIWQKDLQLSEHIIDITNSLYGSLESFLGKEHMCSLRTSENVLNRFKMELIKNKKLMDQQLDDMDSFRNTRQFSIDDEECKLATVENASIIKEGYLFKCSNTLMKIWHKRKCVIKDNCLYVFSENENTIAKLIIPLITCSVKGIDTTSKKFTIVCNGNVNKVYFMAASSQDMNEWIQAIRTVQRRQMYKSISEVHFEGMLDKSNDSLKTIEAIMKIPGNDICCDCNAAGPQWISINFGILLCIECCGVHRELGAHMSRTQSLFMDKISLDSLKVINSRLLSRPSKIAENIGNRKFNSIVCASAEKRHITKSSSIAIRQKYIYSKYKSFAFAVKQAISLDDLFRHIENNDYYGLLLAYVQGLSFLEGNQNHQNHWNALMYAITLSTSENMGIFYFILFNCQAIVSADDNEKSYKYNLNYVDVDGNSVVHLSVMAGNSKILKSLINSGANTEMLNNKGEDALSICQQHGEYNCYQLLAQNVQEEQSGNKLNDIHQTFRSIKDDHLKVQRSYTLPVRTN